MAQQLSEQEIIRREKLQKIQAAGIDPFPAALYPVTHYSTGIKENFTEENKEQYASVCLAGRITSINDKGKVIFYKIQDNQGTIQLYVKRDEICPGEDKSLWDNLVKHNLDFGDIIGATGYVFTTKTGETSLHTQTITLLAKSLKPLPVVKRDEEGNAYDEVTDPEFKYRQRYADLIVNPQVKDVFIKRTKLINTIRDFLNERGAIEVDTPVLQPIPGGAAARPFATHHNALDVPYFMRIANELYLKRLIVGGFDWVYEFSRNFRNEGMDRTHNPEFTVLEWYTAYKDYFWMMEITEQLMEKIAIALHGTTEVTLGENVISYKAPFKRITIFDAIKENTGIDIEEAFNVSEETISEEMYGPNGRANDRNTAIYITRYNRLKDICEKLNLRLDNSAGVGKMIDEIFGTTSEHMYIQPTFIIDYPVEMSPLTKKHRSKPGLVERFELMINGKEAANAYSELNDPIDQRQRFEDQLELMNRGDDEAMFIDHDFLRALEYGMPPTSGIGIGIDRLVMFMTNQPSIQDVLLFPQMRPEKFDEE